MYNGLTTSIKTVLWKVLRNPLASEITLEEAAEFAVEAIRLLGAPLAYEDTITNPPLKVVNHKTALPSNIESIRGVRIITNLDNFEDCPISMRTATDIYHKSTECDPAKTNVPAEYTYSINKGIIFTSIPDGHIQVSYNGLQLDDDGFPLVPDNQKVLLAIEYYILDRYLEPLWMIGKITDKAYQRIEQKRLFYLPSAQNDMRLSGIDNLESVMNTVNRLIVNATAHWDGYKRSGEKERIKKYN